MPRKLILHMEQFELGTFLPQLLGDLRILISVLFQMSLCNLEQFEGLVVFLQVGVLLCLEDGSDEILGV